MSVTYLSIDVMMKMGGEFNASDYLSSSHESTSTSSASHELASFSRGFEGGRGDDMEKRKTLFPFDYLVPSHGGTSTTPASHELVSFSRGLKEGGEVT